jgi:hypothetical protein
MNFRFLNSVLLFLFTATSIALHGSSFAEDELRQLYEFSCHQRSDINEHVGLLRKLAKECSSVTEIGLRGTVSIWGILQGLADNPSPVRSYLGIGLVAPTGRILDLAKLLAKGNGISFRFCQAYDGYINIEPTEMLFIDSFHTYCHLTYELETFSPYVSKYIAMHDTSAPWGNADEPVHFDNPMQYPPEYDRNKRGLWPAIQDFLQRHPEWILLERRLNNHGFTVLKRNSS